MSHYYLTLLSYIQQMTLYGVLLSCADKRLYRSEMRLFCQAINCIFNLKSKY